MDTLLTHHLYACCLLLKRIQLVALSQSIEFYSNQWDDDFDEHSFQRSYYTSTSLFVKLVYIQNWSFRLGIIIEEKLGQIFVTLCISKVLTIFGNECFSISVVVVVADATHLCQDGLQI